MVMIDRFKNWLKRKENKKAKLENTLNSIRELIKEAKDLLSYSLDKRKFDIGYLDYYNNEGYFSIALIAIDREVNINPFKDEILSYIEYVDNKYGINWEKSYIMRDFISSGNPDNFKKIPLTEIYSYNGRFQAIDISIILNV